MPSNLAKAESPPAAAMSSEVSSGVMAAHVKHSVYNKSNMVCNQILNNPFSIAAVASDKQKSGGRSIDIAVKLAKAKGWNQSEFARRMTLAGEKPVTPGAFSNWKRRGMPPEHIETASRVLNCSADELLGRESRVTPGIKGSATIVPIKPSLPLSAAACEIYTHLSEFKKGMVEQFILGLAEKAQEPEKANLRKKKPRG
jgi:hypothetical protein